MESGQALLVQRANGKVQTLRDFLDINQPFSLSKQSFFSSALILAAFISSI